VTAWIGETAAPCGGLKPFAALQAVLKFASIPDWLPVSLTYVK
jgi:hypothetical protein